jgi:hypothetical protein
MRAIIVGAGFGGLAAVHRLAQAGVHTALIDRNIYATFQPLLYQVATAGLTGSDVAYPIRAVARKYQAAFRHGELTGLADDITVRAAGVAAPAGGRHPGPAAGGRRPHPHRARPCGSPGRTGSSPSATSRSPTANRHRSSPSRPCRWAGR